MEGSTHFSRIRIQRLIDAHRNPLRPALFLDRDGIIVKDHGYVGRIEDLEPIDDIAKIIHWARSEGFWVIVATNQSGIARGKYTIKDYEECTRYLNRYFAKLGVQFDAWYSCPYHPQGFIPTLQRDSILRKPAPGMLMAALEDFPIDLTRSFMIGDKDTDCFEGVPEVQTLLLRGRYELKRTDLPIFDSLAEILTHLTSQVRRKTSEQPAELA